MKSRSVLVYLPNHFSSRCLSIPITMRCILRKAATYVPVSSSPNETAETIKIETPRPKQLTLRIPPYNPSNIPLVSPGVYPNTLRTFSLSSDTGSGTSFQFPDSEISGTLPGAYTKPAFSSVKKAKDSPSKPGTPGTPKLPKLRLKRKRDGDEYEIDKEKSNFDVLEKADAQNIAGSLAEDTKEATNQKNAQQKSGMCDFSS